jgi:predicted NAD/FAD-dependent oxidoreductase
MRVAVIGGGIAGVTCARELMRGGVQVTLLDRGHRLGGRLGAQTLRDTGTRWDGHIVDVGASYFTAASSEFTTQVNDWITRGIVCEWTNTFHIADPQGLIGPKIGPMRYATPAGLRSVVKDVATQLDGGVDVRHPVDVQQVTWLEGLVVDGEQYDAVAICAPDPQSLRLIDETASNLDGVRTVLEGHTRAWEPTMALIAVAQEPYWPEFDGVFVNDDAILTWIADDGRRRGDDAAVLVAHSTAVLASGHLADPIAAAPAMLAALRSTLGVQRDPDWFTVKRWTYAKPQSARPEACHWDPAARVGIAGDSWGGQPRVEAAYLSGLALGTAILTLR